MNSKVLLVSSSFPPYVTPSAVLVKNIFDKYQGEIKAVASSNFTKIDSNFIAPCETIYIKHPTGRLAESISRRYHHQFLFYYYYKILEVAKEFRPNIIFANYPRDVMLVAAYKVSRKLGIPLYVYMHDLWYENVSPFKGVVKFAKKWNSLIINNAERVICCTENAQSHYKEKYNIETNLLYHAIPDEDIKENSLTNASDKSIITIAYAGSISASMNLDAFMTIKKALNLLSDSFRLIIYPITKIDLNALGLNDKKITQEIVNRDELKIKLHQADIVFAPLSFNSLTPREIMTVFSNKLLSYLVCNTPILVFGPKNCYHNICATKGGWGLVVYENSPKKLARAINQIAGKNFDKNTMVKNAFLEADKRRASKAAKKIKFWVEKDSTF